MFLKINNDNESVSNSNSNYVTVEILKDSLSPYKVGDLITMHRSTAEALTTHGKVRIMESN